MTIQGLLAYYYRILHPGTGLDVNRCVYNCMADNPRDVGGFGKGECRDGTQDCDDCRLKEVCHTLAPMYVQCAHDFINLLIKRNLVYDRWRPSRTCTSPSARSPGPALEVPTARTARFAASSTRGGSTSGGTWSAGGAPTMGGTPGRSTRSTTTASAGALAPAATRPSRSSSFRPHKARVAARRRSRPVLWCF